MEDLILTADNVQKRYGRHKILNGVSMSVKKGEIYGLLGKNGSGKTTMFRIITGLIPNYNGKIAIGVNNDPKCKVSAVINSPSLFLNMDSFQNMNLQAYLLGIKNREKIEEVLTEIGLIKHSKKPVGTFSLGMIQRLRLGVALLSQPNVLLLDEPSNGLDPDGIVELRELLIGLNRSKNITLLVSSHILNELEQLATNIGILHNGKIVKQETLTSILENFRSLEEFYLSYTKGEQQ